MKVNLGCGNKILQGWVNLDKYDVYPVDVVHDLETFPYPFETGSCTEILMNHVLEHLGADADIFNGVVKELHRICASMTPGSTSMCRTHGTTLFCPTQHTCVQ